MILPITLPPKSSSGSTALPPVLTRLGSSELFLLELQGELDVSGDKHGQLVGRLTIDDDAIDGKVRALSFTLLHFPPDIRSHFPFLSQGQADAANRPSPLGGQDCQLAQATGRITTYMRAAATNKLA